MEEIIIKNKDNNRLDLELSRHPLLKSRQQAKKMILAGLVTVNQKKTTNDYRLQEQDLVRFIIPKKKEDLKLTAITGKLDIVYEEQNLLVVNKPAGMIVHTSESYQGICLVNYLLAHVQTNNSKLSNSIEKYRDGIVHRIDKDTSGLLVVAKDNFFHQKLKEQFQLHLIHRKYLCLVCSPNKLLSGTIDLNISRNTTKRISFKVNEHGKNAITKWKIIKSWNNIHLVECLLETGRTHQIRVHLSAIGMPIVGDSIYGRLKTNLLKHFSPQLKQKILQFPRQALHAAELGFTHPKTKKKLFFNSKLPSDLQQLINELNKATSLTKIQY